MARRVSVVLACQLVSVGCEETHLLSVQWTGYGLRLCDWLSHLANWCAQFLLGALLVLLGWGWTLTGR